jgi:hypothetical protein
MVTAGFIGFCFDTKEIANSQVSKLKRETPKMALLDEKI